MGNSDSLLCIILFYVKNFQKQIFRHHHKSFLARIEYIPPLKNIFVDKKL